MELILVVIIISFLLASIDSATGMGFGTGLSPFLFLLGYNSLQVVPALLIAQTISGMMSAYFDHIFENINFSFAPPNDATKYAFLFAIIGCLSITFSIFLAYYAIKFPEVIIKTYIAVLVFIMGIIGILRLKMSKRIKQMKHKQNKVHPRLLLIFSAIAGFNKGITSGGYGPVITLGQIFSGIYEKSARAIVAFSESLVSIVGTISFLLISSVGVKIDLVLLPSIFTGGFFGALIAPYVVRVLPNKVWRIFIPLYALILGILILINLFLI
ncbi:MAG: sulfite exporter TauE/SafE family protein [Promethearchaeota archaeon]|nr:MAG: sulfite exporter TauE/SafE family protein [Candidatus Lokiarchaeota archaeon]